MHSPVGWNGRARTQVNQRSSSRVVSLFVARERERALGKMLGLAWSVGCLRGQAVIGQLDPELELLHQTLSPTSYVEEERERWTLAPSTPVYLSSTRERSRATHEASSIPLVSSLCSLADAPSSQVERY